MNKNIKALLDFLKLVGHKGAFELRQPINKSYYAHDLRELEKLLVKLFKNDEDFYYGIFERVNALSGHKASKNENIKGTRFYVIDLDFKDPYWRGDKKKLKIVEKLKEYLKPALIVDSGRGAHFYVVFNEYIDKDLWDKEAWEFFLKRISKETKVPLEDARKGQAWGLDPAVKDIVRVIRVPGSYNKKASRRGEIIYSDFYNYREIDYKSQVLNPYLEEKIQKEIKEKKKREARKIKREIEQESFTFDRVRFKEDIYTILDRLEDEIDFIELLKEEGYDYKEYADRVHFFSPFRDDGRNPDFVIYKSNPYWGYDFKEGKSFSPYHYLVEVKGYTPKEAIIELIKRANLEDELLETYTYTKKQKTRRKNGKENIQHKNDKNQALEKEEKENEYIPFFPWAIDFINEYEPARNWIEKIRNANENERLNLLFEFAKTALPYLQAHNIEEPVKVLFYILKYLVEELGLTLINNPLAIIKPNRKSLTYSYISNLFIPLFEFVDQKGKRKYLVMEVKDEDELKIAIKVLKRELTLEQLKAIASDKDINIFLYREGQKINENTFPLTCGVERGTEKKIFEVFNLMLAFLKFYKIIREEKVATKLGFVNFKKKEVFVHPNRQTDVYIDVDESVLDDHFNDNFTYYEKEQAKKYAKIFKYLEDENKALATFMFGFSALLHNKFSKDNFIVQLYGTTGTGKTTMLRIIKSLVGNPERILSLNATLNAMEKLLSEEPEIHIRDEFELADKEVLLRLIYTFTQGYGRQRLTKFLSLQKQNKFTGGLFLAGEKTIDRVVEEKKAQGEITKRGALRRVLKIEVDDEFFKNKEVIGEIRDIIDDYYGFSNYFVDKYKDIENKFGKERLQTIHKVIKVALQKANLDRHAEVFATNVISLYTLKHALKTLGEDHINENKILDEFVKLAKKVRVDIGKSKNERISLYKELFDFAFNHENTYINIGNYEKTPRFALMKLFEITPEYLEKINVQRNIAKQVMLAITEEALEEFCKTKGYDKKIVFSILNKDKRLFVKENGEKYIVNFYENNGAFTLVKKKAYLIALPYEVIHIKNESGETVDIDFKFLLQEEKTGIKNNDFLLEFILKHSFLLFEIEDLPQIWQNHVASEALKITIGKMIELLYQKTKKTPTDDNEDVNIILEEIYNNYNLLEIFDTYYDNHRLYGHILLSALPYLEEMDIQEIKKRL